MPIVIIEMWEGRSEVEKRGIVEGITRVFEETIGTSSDSLSIIFHEVPSNSWGVAGRLVIDDEKMN